MANSATSQIGTSGISQAVDELVQMAESQRRPWSRRWYDNNFFDDGFHFRFINRKTGRVIDHTHNDLQHIRRAIPKASRQIRGMANLLQSRDFVPIVFPDHVDKTNYNSKDPLIANGQPLLDPSAKPMTEYDMALLVSKEVAQKTGRWITNQWDEDKLDLGSKLNQMLILTMKHSVSFLQVWPDAVDQAIKAQVYDAFDIYLDGSLNDINDSPFIIKASPKVIARIKANEIFDREQLQKIHSDNKYASDEVKEAYMQSKFGDRKRGDTTATLILKEAYLMEYVNDRVMERVREQASDKDPSGTAQRDAEFLLAKKQIKNGDPIIRQVFSAGGVWLRDKYISLAHYPFVDLRLEPGSIYQTPQIERFIPSNKALDMVVSRVERHLHTMTVGIWTKRKGENFNVSNIPGGQMVEYDGVPPTQAPMASIPNYVQNFIDLLTSFIEEQGVSTTALGRIPKGVKAASAIESLKESEFANLAIAIKQTRKTVKGIAQKMLDIADTHFIKPEAVQILNNGQPDYFQVIGQTGVDLKKRLKDKLPSDIVPIKKDYKVQISVEEGIAHTPQGRKQAILELGEFMKTLVAEGLLDQKTIAIVIRKLLDTFSFGNTQEFMDAFEQAQSTQEAEGEIDDATIEKMKVAFLEVIKALGAGGQPAQAQQPIAQGGV